MINLKQKIWLCVGGALVLAFCGRSSWNSAQTVKNEAAFQEQIRLARKEGLPTTLDEYRATFPNVQPSQNAAPLYAQLNQTEMRSPYVSSGYREAIQVIFYPSKRAIDTVKRMLADDRPYFEIIDKAVARPRCLFDRDWQNAPTAQLDESFWMMTKAASIVGLRGSVSAAEGRTDDALADARRIFTISRHASEEPSPSAAASSENIYMTGVSRLVSWTYAYRRPEYLAELKKAIDGFPRVDVRREHRQDLYFILWRLDNSRTPEGRLKMGVSGDDVIDLQNSDDLARYTSSRSEAKVRIVRAVRACWQALQRPHTERAMLLKGASKDLNDALSVFPTVYALSPTLDANTRERDWELERQVFSAAVRALEAKQTPKEIRTGDLLSPYDRRPLSYRYDGQRMTFVASMGQGSNQTLTLPPTEPPRFRAVGDGNRYYGFLGTMPRRFNPGRVPGGPPREATVTAR